MSIVVLVTASVVFVLAIGSGLAIRHHKVSIGLLSVACVAFLPVLFLANEEGKKVDATCVDLSCQGEGWLPILGSLALGGAILVAGYGLGRLIAYLRRPVVGRRHPRWHYR